MAIPASASRDLDRLLLLWGKLGPDSAYHPALYHMLDVGMVARHLLTPDAPTRFRAVLGFVLEVDPAGLAEWLPLLVALHDIGKISGPFQGMESAPQTRAARARLAAAGFIFGETHGQRYPHQQISANWVARAWPGLEPGLPRALATVERDALGGHHGVFSAPGELNTVARYLKAEEPPEWAQLRAAAYGVLRAVLAPQPAGWASPQHIRAAAMALAGFTIFCDWIGSDSHYFPPEPSLPLEEYLRHSEERAAAALRHVDILPARPAPTYPGFSGRFPRIPDPRPLQEAIDDLPAPALAWPALFIIEAPTGEGKTEAALALATRLAAGGPSDELYFALPTQATSNQMFGRVYAHINRGDRPAALKLIHGNSFLVEDDLLLRLADDADGTNAVAAAEWFGPKKRALLAPFGVGTVDQVELTALSARHYMLRLFGLAGKTVIIDEVHAYDTYMSTILEHTVGWLATLGTSVILLSATLPAARHRALADAFHRALPQPAAPVPAPSPLPYPCIATYTRDVAELRPVEASRPGRTLAVTFVSDTTVDRQAERLLGLIAGGGAVCRVCNTVAAAQELFTAVRRRDPAVDVLLLHSRFPLQRRQEIETLLTKRFGPGATRTVAGRFVVIGTQVLEQSLDLDFDGMVSDHAPLDLLLQRAGRLHRHQRDRPAGLAHPEFQIQLPRDGEGRPQFGVWAFVYSEYVLWTSWLALQARARDGHLGVTLPADYRPLVEAAYPEGDPPLPDWFRWGVELREARAEYDREEQNMADEARLRLIPEPDARGGITEGTVVRFEEDEEGGSGKWGAARTRLGAESVTVIPLHEIDGALYLDAGGTNRVPSHPDRARQLRMLQHSVPITVGRGRRALSTRWQADRDRHAALFRRDSLLRHALPLILHGGRQRVDRFSLQLDPDLGLVISKEEA